jgi:hypothetical protein
MSSVLSFPEKRRKKKRVGLKSYRITKHGRSFLSHIYMVFFFVLFCFVLFNLIFRLRWRRNKQCDNKNIARVLSHWYQIKYVIKFVTTFWHIKFSSIKVLPCSKLIICKTSMHLLNIDILKKKRNVLSVYIFSKCYTMYIVVVLLKLWCEIKITFKENNQCYSFIIICNIHNRTRHDIKWNVSVYFNFIYSWGIASLITIKETGFMIINAVQPSYCKQQMT